MHKLIINRYVGNIGFRLAYKSSSKSAIRCRIATAIRSLLRSAIVRARASERVARASESSTCFLCWKSNQVTLFWRELFRVRSRGKVSIITFPVSYNGPLAMLFCAQTEEKITPTLTNLFFMFLQFQKYFLTMWWVYRECCLTKKVIFRIE